MLGVKLRKPVLLIYNIKPNIEVNGLLYQTKLHINLIVNPKNIKIKDFIKWAELPDISLNSAPIHKLKQLLNWSLLSHKFLKR